MEEVKTKTVVRGHDDDDSNGGPLDGERMAASRQFWTMGDVVSASSILGSWWREECGMGVVLVQVPLERGVFGARLWYHSFVMLLW